MPVHDDLGLRMKDFYEYIPRTRLMRRTPVMIRIDGKAFHTFTRGFEKPFDDVLIKTMQDTTKYLCENIQGCVLGYTQSDEISLVLIDYKRLESSAWFNYEIQKMCSIAASMATMAFNRFFYKNVEEWKNNNFVDNLGYLFVTYKKAIEKGAMFDCRVFNIPKEEVTNCLYWRQLDATRNSIQMVGQANFPHNELQNKTCSDIQNMLMTQKGINWNDLPTYQKRGSCVVKGKKILENPSELGDEIVDPVRTEWYIDTNIPIFKGDGRSYVDNLVFLDGDRQ